MRKENGNMKYDSNVALSNTAAFDSFGEVLTVNGCKVSLNFLPESNGKTIDTVKKMLVSSQYRNISGK